MLPVLFSVANIPVTSFGLFLTLSILAALFIIWRAAQVYEIDPEKLLDIFFLTVFFSFVSARVYFALFHSELFSEPVRLVLINRYPGLSFWGGLFGGILALKLLSGRFKANLWQVYDFATVGLFLALPLGSLGCLLGSCGYGSISNSPLAVSQAGVIGPRFPLQAVEASLFLLSFFYLWKGLLRFHFAGSILAQGAMLLGLIKFGAEFFRGDVQLIPLLNLSFGFAWSLLSLVSGVVVFYRQSRRSLSTDLKYVLTLSINSQHRKQLFSNLQRSCYNLLISLHFGAKNWRRNLLRSFNLKSNPTKFG